eukprot:g949.t1
MSTVITGLCGIICGKYPVFFSVRHGQPPATTPLSTLSSVQTFEQEFASFFVLKQDLQRFVARKVLSLCPRYCVTQLMAMSICALFFTSNYGKTIHLLSHVPLSKRYC